MRQVEQYFLDVIKEERHDFAAFILRKLLFVLSRLYSFVMKKRNRQFDTGVRHMYAAPVPVISIGNITTGGTGKTPMVRYVCEYLQTRKERPVVLSRGYKARDNRHSLIVSDGTSMLLDTATSGDEANLLARSLPQVPVIIGRSREESAKIAVAELEASVLVLDDAFQHRQIRRNLDIVLIDCTIPFGFGYVLPRGLLREPLEGLRRAQVIVFTKANQIEAKKLAALEQQVKTLAPQAVQAVSVHQPGKAIPLEVWRAKKNILPHQSMPQRVFAMSGIGNPTSFAKTLTEAGFEMVKMAAYGDHHNFTESDLANAVSAAKDCGAEGIMITEKDAIKLFPLCENKKIDMPIWVIGISIEIIKGEEAFKRCLNVGKD